MTEDIWHGGDLAKARALFPAAPQPWIDLSTGINPIPYPLPALPLSLWQRLPGQAEEQALLRAARAAYGVPDGAEIVAAPGTQILIELLPRLVGIGQIAVLGPTYAEHEAAWRKAGFPVRAITDLAEARQAGIVVLVNPNNPDGRRMPLPALHALAGSLAQRGGLLVVDEAFCDFTPQHSLVPSVPPNTVVLRSFGKSYGLAGLRLGFAIGEAQPMQRLREALGPWAVAGPALQIGAQALADAAWLRLAAAAREADAARLDAMLVRCGVVVGGTALFRLLETDNAAQLFERLGRHGVYVRRFQHDPRRLRFGLPGDSAQWARLERAICDGPPAPDAA
ncbi:MAG: threonine-phosphate decarboxylase CobD [Bosea sp. (in: a-proteobacteria)]